jgi:hypothetical protein
VSRQGDPARFVVVKRWMAMLDKLTLVLQTTPRVLEASRWTWDAAFAKTRAHSRRPASLGAALMATEKLRLHMQGAWLLCGGVVIFAAVATVSMSLWL